MWTIAFEKWYKKHRSFIEEKGIHQPTNRGGTGYRQMRRCAVLIKTALPNMFHFIANKNIPKSTNGIDSYFGHHKLNLNVHRGLTYEHRRKLCVMVSIPKG